MFIIMCKVLTLLLIFSSCSIFVGGRNRPVGPTEVMKEEKQLLLSSSSCQRYILLTTQRSGSTWTCTLFDLQNEVTCGGKQFNEELGRESEIMSKKYSRMSFERIESVTWSQYEKDLTAAIQTSINVNDLCHPSSSSTIAAAAGFKLMYSQVPPQFIKSGQIFDYFEKNDIAIIHLVREAKILKIASGKQSVGMPGGQPHTTDDSVVSKLRKKNEVMTWTNRTVKAIRREEERDSIWKRLLVSKPKLKYHRLVYERMLYREILSSDLADVLMFLNVGHQKSLNLDSRLLQLHSAACNGRIDRYKEFRKAIAGTITLEACDMLDQMEKL